MLKDQFPNMVIPQTNFVTCLLVANFEYILESGEDGVCKKILEEKSDLSVFPHVKERIEKYIAERESGDERGTI